LALKANSAKQLRARQTIRATAFILLEKGNINIRKIKAQKKQRKAERLPVKNRAEKSITAKNAVYTHVIGRLLFDLIKMNHKHTGTVRIKWAARELLNAKVEKTKLLLLKSLDFKAGEIAMPLLIILSVTKALVSFNPKKY
jgi:hypothetical protein